MEIDEQRLALGRLERLTLHARARIEAEQQVQVFGVALRRERADRRTDQLEGVERP